MHVSSGRVPCTNSCLCELTWSSPKIVCKINKSASLHPLQIVYKNNSIPQRFSDTRENSGGNNLKQVHCDPPVTESRICYKLNPNKAGPFESSF